MLALLQLPLLRLLSPVAMLSLRLYVGWFLIVGVWDNITSAERMKEFEGFLQTLNCPMPEIAAPVSVWAQFAVGVLLIPGLFARIAGIVLAINFIVAVLLLAPTGASERDLFPPAILIFIGAVFATVGTGPLSLDTLFGGKKPPQV